MRIAAFMPLHRPIALGRRSGIKAVLHGPVHGAGERQSILSSTSLPENVKVPKNLTPMACAHL